MTNLATTRSELNDCPERSGWIIRQLGPRSDVALLDLLHGYSRADRHPKINQMILDRISQSTAPLMAWTAGVFVASELTGVVRAAPTTPGYVEARLFVDEEWRRQGIGSMLLRETMDWARRGEATTLRLACDRTDWPMRHLAEKFGARLDLVFGEMVADIDLVQP